MPSRALPLLAALTLVLLLLPVPALAQDSRKGDGSFKGDTYLKVADDTDSSQYRVWKLTTDENEGADTDPSDNEWDLNASENITFTLRNASNGIAPPDGANGDAGDVFEITAWYDNSTSEENLLFTLYNDTVEPADGETFTVNATEDGSSGAAGRVGIIRLRIRIRSEGGLGAWTASSDEGTTEGTGTVDSTIGQGYARSWANVTGFTTYSDAAFTQEETKFMRGETVRGEFNTSASTWNETGVETVSLSFVGGGTTFSVNKNLSFANNTYRVSWDMPVDANLNDYDANFRILGTSEGFTREYTDEFAHTSCSDSSAADGGDCVYNSSGTVTLGGTVTGKNIIVENDTTIQVEDCTGSSCSGSEGNLTLEANGSIIIKSGSKIDATAVGFTGGAGAPAKSGSTCPTAEGGNDGTSPKDGGGGGGDSSGGSGGGGGYGGVGGVGLSTTGGEAGDTYGAETDQGFFHGSGGGGGGNGDCQCTLGDCSLASGGDGGDGGGVIVLEADDNVTVKGKVKARSADGTKGGFGGSGDGGGGSGGAIFINTSSITLEGTLNVQGGNSGSDGGGDGGGGAGGRVKMFTESIDNSGTILTSGGNSGNDGGDKGTSHTAAGEFFTKFQSSGLGFSSETLSTFTINEMNDTDNPLSQTNTSFWVEEELNLIHDYSPQLNQSNGSTVFQYLMHNETLNYSFTVQDEWNRSFANENINISVNTTSAEFHVANLTTDSTGGIEDNVTIGTDWTNTYNNKTPANTTEFRDYAINVKFPVDVVSAVNGSYGENGTQDFMFDVSGLIIDSHIQNTSTLSKDAMNDAGETEEYALNEENVYVWAHVQNVRGADQNGKNVTVWAYAQGDGRDSAADSFSGNTGSDGWTSRIGNFTATSPAGTWFFDAATGPDVDSNSGDDKEDAEFVTTGLTTDGRIFFWENGTPTASASVTATVIDDGEELGSGTDTTNSNGDYSITIDVSLVSGKDYTLNITATKGNQKSHLTQRFVR